ncbi:unnamed protein product, partial [Darwinula stevensoni]
REAGIRIEEVHVVGHSLGAQTSSYIGSALKDMGVGKLGRITGLDPSGYYFEFTDPRVRLDPEDALFVDAIHTDGVHASGAMRLVAGFGTLQPMGHVDFYPNSGARMPGCGLTLQGAFGKGMFGNGIRSPFSRGSDGLTRFTVCNHLKAYEYFIESINSPCSFLAHQCSNWFEFV